MFQLLIAGLLFIIHVLLLALPLLMFASKFRFPFVLRHAQCRHTCIQKNGVALARLSHERHEVGAYDIPGTQLEEDATSGRRIPPHETLEVAKAFCKNVMKANNHEWRRKSSVHVYRGIAKGMHTTAF